MESKQEAILHVLRTDLMQLEDVHQCGVVRKNLEGIFPLSDEFREEVINIWGTLKGTIDALFDVISHYTDYGLDKIYFELGEWDVLFFILPGMDTALVAIVPALANRGLLEVELENARREIIRILAQE
ncbi:MAG: hypothetical protein ABH851_09790 [Methanobacteriota archaeon]